MYCLTIIFFYNYTFCQNTAWNLVLEKEVARFIGDQVYETDSFYYVAGTSIDTFGMVEQGFTVSKVDKKDASVVATRHYDEEGVQLDFDYCRNGFLIGDVIYLPQATLTYPASVQLFGINIYTLAVEKLCSVPPPDPASKYTMFLLDFQRIGDDLYIMTEYYIGEYNTPTFKSIPIVIKYNISSKEHRIIRSFEGYGRMSINKMAKFNDQCLLFGSIAGSILATGKMIIFYLDREGNLLWEYQTPFTSPVYDVKDVYPLNDREVLLASYDSYFSYEDHYLYSRWTVTRYDVPDNKIIWSSYWDEPRTPNIWNYARIVKAKNDGEFLLMANDYVGNDTSNYTVGKVVKFNGNGQRLWQKTYYYNNTLWSLRNEFNNMIPVSDNSYLIVGAENLVQSPWVIKIDEEGNIVPIDTTSSAYGTERSPAIAGIKVYPNPSGDRIIINQGEMRDMRYELRDLSGLRVRTLDQTEAHQNVIWDIRDVPPGIYVLLILQDGKVMGSRQVVVAR